MKADIPEQRRIDEARLQKAESWVKMHQICQMMENIPTTTGDGYSALDHVELIFFFFKKAEHNENSKIWANYDLGISNTCYILVKDDAWHFLCLLSRNLNSTGVNSA